MTETHKNLDKPVGRKVGWERLDTHYPYVYRRFKIRQDQVRLPNGNELEFAYTETKGAVFIVPVTDDGHVILIRQYRYPPDEWCWEVPAGSMFDHQGTLEELARRELSEEIGASVDELVHVTWFYGAAGTSDTVCHVMLARGTRLDGTPQREATEFIEVHVTPVANALSLARGGEMRDGRSALALLLCEPYLKACQEE